MDIFYFNNPSQPVLLRSEGGFKWRGKPSAKRREVDSGMDSSLYRAHVVRVVETSVVANDLSTLQTHHLNALLDAGYTPSLPDSAPNLADQRLDSLAPKHDGLVLFPGQTAVDTEAVLSRDRGSAQNTPPTDHPRPESSDIWEEEDSRRIRFALQDDNDDHVVRLSHSNASAPNPQNQTPDLSAPVDRRNGSQVAPFRIFPRHTDPLDLFLPQPLALHSFAERFALPMPSAPLLPHDSATQLLWDDNLLAVDDHRRSYDFADFMDEWILKPSRNRDLPAFEPVTGPSLWREPRRDYERLNTQAAQRDLQGLSWDAMGVPRQSALKARRLLHPHRTNYTTETDVEAVNCESLHYKPRAFVPDHRARFSHYQLRNLMAPTRGRDVCYGRGSKVMKTSLSCPLAKHTVMDLERPSHSTCPFNVTCLATSDSSNTQVDEVLIAGGFNGEYALLDLNSEASCKPSEGVVSHAKDGIVNHIDAFRDRQSGSIHATFCSNDHKVCVLDIHSQTFTKTFEYDRAVNCSAMCPDGRLRALVHDGSDSWITSTETGEILVKLEAHTDFAFACAWSTCGRYVATGAEDRQVIVWDARNWTRPMKKLDCVMSCARSLHFTNDGALVIAESEDVVSIVNTATFASRQDIRFFGTIAGLSLLGGGAEMVVANADETVGGLMSFERVTQWYVSDQCGSKRKTARGRRSPGRRYNTSIVEELLG